MAQVYTMTAPAQPGLTPPPGGKKSGSHDVLSRAIAQDTSSIYLFLHVVELLTGRATIVVPAFSDPFSMQPYSVLTIAGCIISTTILVAARMYTKRWIMKSTLWEDCTRRFAYEEQRQSSC